MNFGEIIVSTYQDQGLTFLRLLSNSSPITSSSLVDISYGEGMNEQQCLWNSSCALDSCFSSVWFQLIIHKTPSQVHWFAGRLHVHPMDSISDISIRSTYLPLQCWNKILSFHSSSGDIDMPYEPATVVCLDMLIHIDLESTFFALLYFHIVSHLRIVLMLIVYSVKVEKSNIFDTLDQERTYCNSFWSSCTYLIIEQ